MTGGQIPALLAALQELVMGSTLVKCGATDVGIQWAGWALSAAFRTEKFYDLAGNVAEPANFFRVKIVGLNSLQKKETKLNISRV